MMKMKMKHSIRFLGLYLGSKLRRTTLNNFKNNVKKRYLTVLIESTCTLCVTCAT